MITLAIETSGRSLSAALLKDDSSWETRVDAGFKHGETLMPAIASLFELAGFSPKDLELIACSAGPGSFTGLRIGMATAKGIAKGAGCPIKAVPTLPVLAADREHWPGIVVPVMDARKQRVYAAAFENGRQIAADTDMALEEFLSTLPSNKPILATGPDASIAAGITGVTVDPLCASPRGMALAKAGIKSFEADGGDPPDLGPIYIRLSEAEEALADRS